MKRQIHKQELGFTLIEIIVVMAIGAIIMVIVFITLQQGRVGQRDDARKHYLAQIAEGLEAYKEMSQNSFQYPQTNLDFNNKFGNGATYHVTGAGEFLDVDPSNRVAYTYATSVPGAWGAGDPPANIYYQPGFVCSGASSGGYRLYITLERGGPYCLDNH